MMSHPEHRHSKGKRITERNRTQFYVYAIIGNKPVLYGGYSTRSEADRAGMTRANGVYETFELEAPNVQEASAILRERGILGQGTDSLRHFRHK